MDQNLSENNTATALQDFYDRLERADWYYDFSDDDRVWRAGTAAFQRLRAEAHSDPAKLALYGAFHDHMFSGPSWKTPRAPKPKRP